jgi:hypothetical protein
LRWLLDLPAMIGLLADGSLQAVSPDHSPWFCKEKNDGGRNDFTQISNGAARPSKSI